MADILSQHYPPSEPAHVIRFYDDIFAILSHVRTIGQEEIDLVFDKVSAQLGFVLTTTLPVAVEVPEDGKVKVLAMQGKHLAGTLFEKEMVPALNKILAKKPIPANKGSVVTKGIYEIYFLWFKALKLKKRVIIYPMGNLNPGFSKGRFALPPEPKHWFDPEAFISQEEQVVVLALDEVYPELRLWERISAYRSNPEVAALLHSQPLPPRP